VLAEFGLSVPPELKPHYNLPLTTRAPAITRERGVTQLAPLAFGLLLPPKETAAKPLLLANARSETMLAKAAFQSAARHRRCLVPADGFFEWEKQGAARLPHYFQRADGAPFFFAGLWRTETPTSPAAFVIVTTRPNRLLEPIHDRMPVLLEGDAAQQWLGDTPLPDERISALCAPFPAEKLTSHRVHPRMNSARHEGADCIAPWTPPPPEPTLFD
jgi:putative SOS response-associated peptidase YedK